MGKCHLSQAANNQTLESSSSESRQTLHFECTFLFPVQPPPSKKFSVNIDVNVVVDAKNCSCFAFPLIWERNARMVLIMLLVCFSYDFTAINPQAGLHLTKIRQQWSQVQITDRVLLCMLCAFYTCLDNRLLSTRQESILQQSHPCLKYSSGLPTSLSRPRFQGQCFLPKAPGFGLPLAEESREIYGTFVMFDLLAVYKLSIRWR